MLSLTRLAGLSNLLGDQMIAGNADANDKVVSKRSIRKGDLYLDKHQVTKIKNRRGGQYHRMPVVVLLGSITRSSGELTAIAFNPDLTHISSANLPLKDTRPGR